MRNEGVAEIARQLGCSKAYVSMVMSGKRRPSKSVALKLRGLGISVESSGMVNSVNFQSRFNNPKSCLSASSSTSPSAANVIFYHFDRCPALLSQLWPSHSSVPSHTGPHHCHAQDDSCHATATSQRIRL
jgi:hypothetical protein